MQFDLTRLTTTNVLTGIVFVSLFLTTTFLGGIESHVTLAVSIVGTFLLFVTPWFYFRNLSWAHLGLVMFILLVGGGLTAQALYMIWPHSINDNQQFTKILESIHIAPDYSFMSVTPGKTLINLALILGYTGFAVCIACLSANPYTANKIRNLTAILITTFAIYGIVIYVLGNDYVLWYPKDSYLNDLTSTFVNRNFASNFLGIGVITSLAIAFGQIGELSSRQSIKQRFKEFYYKVVIQHRAWLICSLICFCALMASSSRAGSLASIAGIFIFFLTVMLARPPTRIIMGSIIMISFVFLMIIATLGTSVTTRIAADETSSRAYINEISYEIIKNVPLIGYGLGSWSAVAGANRTKELGLNVGSLEYAHNSYLQWIVETGKIGSSVAGGAILVVLATLIYGLSVRRSQIVWPAMGCAVLVQQLIHGWPDGALMLPAIALAVIIIVVSSLMQSIRISEISKKRALIFPLLMGLPFSAFGVLGLCICSYLLWAEIPNYKVREVVGGLNAGYKIPNSQMNSAIQNLQECVKRNPLHPQCGTDLTLAIMAQAAEKGVHTVRGQILLSIAKRQGELALMTSPMQPYLAYRMARIEQFRGNYSHAYEFLNYSYKWLPIEKELAFARLKLGIILDKYVEEDQKQAFYVNTQLLWDMDAGRVWSTIKYVSGSDIILRKALSPYANDPVTAKKWESLVKQKW